jgi:hypothetical protein
VTSKAQITRVASRDGVDAFSSDCSAETSSISICCWRTKIRRMSSKEYAKRWEQELGEYLGDVPHFHEVERNVRRTLRRASLV